MIKPTKKVTVKESELTLVSNPKEGKEHSCCDDSDQSKGSLDEKLGQSCCSVSDREMI